MSKKTWAFGAAWAALASAAMVFACTSSDNNGGGGAIHNPYSNCLAANSGETNTQSACGQCMESHCADQVNNFFTGCKDYFDCICGADADILSCASKIQESSCTAAQQAATNCQNTSCKTECAGSSSSGGSSGSGSSSSGSSGSGSSGSGSSSSGSSSSGGSGGDAGLSANCQKVYDCCAIAYADAGAQTVAACQQGATSGSDQTCGYILAGYEDAGVCP